ncbi:PepSY domain-containing protein [Aliiroseovarius sp. 2305UL8-7]|uniref:PepSY domain-containing protein n=1 Tax=Aliiroseovarius conchicola TaxID=3121637 RepID=UPI003527945F
MNTKLITAGALSGLILAGSIAGAVSAQSVADATNLTEEQVIEIALSEVPGEVTEVELEDRRGKQIYEVEITDADGVEREVKIAADTGDVLKVKTDDKDCDSDDDSDDA